MRHVIIQNYKVAENQTKFDKFAFFYSVFILSLI